MKSNFATWMENESKFSKIVLALPLIDLSWWVYRFLISKDEGDLWGMVFSILIGLISVPVSWIVDIVFLAMDKPVLWL